MITAYDIQKHLLMHDASGFRVYADEIVDTYDDLPTASAHTGQVYLVLNSQGVWPFTYKRGGLYRSNGTAWIRIGDMTFVFSDAYFELYNDGDNTKRVEVDLSGITTGNLRTTSFPDRDITLIGNNITEDASGNIGVGEDTPLGKVHIKTSDTGGTADAGADELVIESNGSCGHTILAANNNFSRINFGDAQKTTAGILGLYHATDTFYFGTNNSGGDLSIRSGSYIEALAIDSSQKSWFKGAVDVVGPTQHNDDVTIAVGKKLIFAAS